MGADTGEDPIAGEAEMLEAYIIDELIRRDQKIDHRLPLRPHAHLPYHRPPPAMQEPAGDPCDRKSPSDPRIQRPSRRFCGRG